MWSSAFVAVSKFFAGFRSVVFGTSLWATNLLQCYIACRLCYSIKTLEHCITGLLFCGICCDNITCQVLEALHEWTFASKEHTSELLGRENATWWWLLARLLFEMAVMTILAIPFGLTLLRWSHSKADCKHCCKQSNLNESGRHFWIVDFGFFYEIPWISIATFLILNLTWFRKNLAKIII